MLESFAVEAPCAPSLHPNKDGTWLPKDPTDEKLAKYWTLRAGGTFFVENQDLARVTLLLHKHVIPNGTCNLAQNGRRLHQRQTSREIASGIALAAL